MAWPACLALSVLAWPSVARSGLACHGQGMFLRHKIKIMREIRAGSQFCEERAHALSGQACAGLAQRGLEWPGVSRGMLLHRKNVNHVRNASMITLS